MIAEPSGLRLFLNNGAQGFEERGEPAGLSAIKADVRGLATGDLDGDGDINLVGNVYAGRALVLLNRIEQSASPPSWVSIAARGLNSNRSAFGTKLEVRSGHIQQKLEVRGADGFLSQSSQVMSFGLDGASRVDRVRLLWPLGVLQAELGVEPRKQHTIEELDRKGSSCPFLWAWDGSELSFVSDIQGGSPLGLWLAPGVHNLPDPDEWFLLPDGLAKPREGAYDLRITESLEEVCYLDRVKLRVIDAPSEVHVFPNERLLFEPPFAPYGMHFVRELRAPQAARDGLGRDVRQELAAIDRNSAGALRATRFRGIAEPWTLELDFGTLRPRSPRERLLLLAYGWVEFTNSTPMFAASQDKVEVALPALDMLDSDGRVLATRSDAGAPAGLPKWMVIELDPRQLPRDGRVRLRYRTNMEVHFDYVALGIADPDTPHQTTDIEASGAELRFAGYPAAWSPDGGKPVLYRYAQLKPDETWADQEGMYTRYGDVSELLAREDDRQVVTAHGDELALRFPTEALPALPEGYARHLVLYSVGYAKDLDLHSAEPFSVGPLPYRAMTSYPYEGPGPLEDPAYVASLRVWNTRYVRATAQSFR